MNNLAFPKINPDVLISHGTTSVVLLVLILVFRFVSTQAISRSNTLSYEMKRRWIVQTRGLFVIAAALGLGVIWATELRSIAISVAAVLVAIVIATKEILLCVGGSFYRLISRTFSIGDRIEIGGIRGDVIDHTILSTRMLEVGPGQSTHQATGRIVTIPNSQLLTATVVNEAARDRYGLHVFTIPIHLTSDWKKAEQCLLGIARKKCLPHLEEARNHLERMGQKEGLEPPSAEARVTIRPIETDELEFIVRIGVPFRMKGRIEQEILKEFYSEIESYGPKKDRSA